jgi:hypothetical protein
VYTRLRFPSSFVDVSANKEMLFFLVFASGFVMGIISWFFRNTWGQHFYQFVCKQKYANLLTRSIFCWKGKEDMPYVVLSNTYLFLMPLVAIFSQRSSMAPRLVHSACDRGSWAPFSIASHRMGDQNLLSWAPPSFGRHVMPLVPVAFAVVSTH